MPLSPDPRKAARQLANLDPHARRPERGNRRAVRHGAYAAVARDRLDARAVELFDALSADAPLRDAGELPAADAAAVRLAAEALCRLDDLASYLRDRGLLDEDGRVRPAVELESRLRREAADHLDALGMTPRSRARLGLDLARTVDASVAIAAAAAEPDPALRRDMLARAGLVDVVEVADDEQ